MSADAVYKRARAARQRQLRFPSEQQALVESLSQQLGVRVLDFALERGDRKQLVHVIVEWIADAEGLATEGTRRVVAARFLRYFEDRTASRRDVNKGRVHAFANGVFPPIEVGFGALQTLERAAILATLDTTGIVQQFADVWQIWRNGDRFTVFFTTDEQLNRAKASGLTTAIASAFAAAIALRDEFGHRPEPTIEFDSRQYLDETHGGQPWSYYR